MRFIREIPPRVRDRAIRSIDRFCGARLIWRIEFTALDLRIFKLRAVLFEDCSGIRKIFPAPINFLFST